MWLAIVTALPLIAYYVEYILSEEKHERTQLFLIKIWYKLDNIKFANVGLTEAEYCLSTFDKVFSKRLFSFKRFYSAFMLAGIFVVILYISNESYRIFHGLSVRLPIVTIENNTNIFQESLSTAVALSLARKIIVISIQTSKRFRHSIIYFILFMGISALISQTFFIITAPINLTLGWVFGNIRFEVINFMTTGHLGQMMMGTSDGQGLIPATVGLVIGSLYQSQVAVISGIFEGGLMEHMRVFHMLRSFYLTPLRYVRLTAFATEPEEMGLAYSAWIQLCFSYLRATFFMVFFLFWLSYKLHQFITRSLQALLELKRGALTVMVLGAEAIISALTQLSGHH